MLPKGILFSSSDLASSLLDPSAKAQQLGHNDFSPTLWEWKAEGVKGTGATLEWVVPVLLGRGRPVIRRVLGSWVEAQPQEPVAAINRRGPAHRLQQGDAGEWLDESRLASGRLLDKNFTVTSTGALEIS